ncbi:MAG: magnesium transporter [Puniceicoccales bacterium]|jgi:magnesium transporter|nr:magnesium transporter [Puniceicoccales bacterium]
MGEEGQNLDANGPEETSSEAVREDYGFDELMGLYENDFDGLDRLKLSRTSPHELGQFLARLNASEQTEFLRKLSDRAAGEVIAEMSDSAEVLMQMKDRRALRILENLEPDDAAYIVRQLDANDRGRILGKLQGEAAHTIADLLHYEANTAGGVMTPHVNKIQLSWTVDRAIQTLHTTGDNNENLDVIYVINDEGKLKGTVSLHRIIRSAGAQKIEEIFDSDIQGACHADAASTQVAQIMAEFDLQNLPVLDNLGRLIGMVTHDDVIDILQESATKDIQILHGAGADENIHDPVTYSVAKRAPWLQFNLITAAMGAFVVSLFQSQIEQLSLLAVFMTMITSLGGNAGGQTLAVSIRSLALGDWKNGDTVGIFFREMFKGLFNGSITGLVAGSVCALITRSVPIGATIFLAMTLNMALCGISGALIPRILQKLRVDPAQSAYIFLTMVTDTVGMYIFLLLGCWLLL